ncbi:MAG: cyclodeaminase/cyclohydrolase family protein [Candidatus Omnitrophica bacterium]|nr:cyclodeaminase/cyclohydrolase family protein [Candidatus Omnitrophota bacterium]
MSNQRTLLSYLDELAARKPVPGGGSAAAYIGAVALSLATMAGRYALKRQGKNPGYGRLKQIIAANEVMRKKLIRLMIMDEKAYKRIATNCDKKRSSIAELYKSAAMIPLEMCDIMTKGIDLCCGVLPHCKTSVITDLIEAMILLEAGYKSAELNVKVNLLYVGDRRFKKFVSAQLLRNRAGIRNSIKRANKLNKA